LGGEGDRVMNFASRWALPALAAPLSFAPIASATAEDVAPVEITRKDHEVR
jgi:hypothetical protein